MSYYFAAIVVTHNSQLVIDSCVKSLLDQTIEISQIVLVDSGSDDIEYLDRYKKHSAVTLIKTENVGFSQANNMGFSVIKPEIDYVVLINPDLFVPKDFILNVNESIDRNKDFGILTGKLLGFDLKKNSITGVLDSTGVFRKWYGRWYDRGQGEIDQGQYDTAEFVPAVCGAMMCLPRRVIDKYSGKVFNPDFFIYKEDIELSIRLKKCGFSLCYDPGIIAYHCRGWQQNRKKMSRFLKEQSAVNEIKIYLIHPSIYIFWAIVKYLLVKILKV